MKKRPKNPNSSKSPAYSIVIPAYNEQSRLPATIANLTEFINNQKKSFEVLLVIEKSTDQTLELAKKMVGSDQRFSVINNKVHKGKGYAVKSGILAATGNIIFFMDADLSTDIKSVGEFIHEFDKRPELDVLIGNRTHPDSIIIAPQGAARQTLGKANNLLLRLLGLTRFKDTQCGFKAFRKKPAKELFSQINTNGFSFDVEVLRLAKKIGYQVDDMPVVWHDSNESRVGILTGPLKMIFEIIAIRLRT